MIWLPVVLIVLLVLAGWWLWEKSFARHLRRLESLLRTLANGEYPATFIFSGSRRFAPLGLLLEKIADERERLELQQSENEFNLHAILSSMAEGVLVVDRQRTIRLFNQSFLKLFPVSGNPLHRTILSALRDSAVDQIVEAALNSQEPKISEIAVANPSGQGTRHLNLSVVPITGAKENTSGVVMVFHEITRLRELETVRREFVANVSHELRTPLSIFRGYLENLLDDPSIRRPQLVDILKIMQKHALRLTALAEDLLTLARLESRQETLKSEPIDLPKFFSQLLRDWGGEFRKKEIEITTVIEPDLPPLHADQMRIEQIFNNLLENAVAYTGESGKISIAARALDDTIEISVADTGVGVSAEHLPHIFERFYRVETARSRATGGTGLGLSIVKHIAALHSASVRAESEPGHGTTIILKFPVGP